MRVATTHGTWADVIDQEVALRCEGQLRADLTKAELAAIIFEQRHHDRVRRCHWGQSRFLLDPFSNIWAGSTIVMRIVGRRSVRAARRGGAQMCGIAGVLGGPKVEAETILRMTRALAHRGPDDEGVWLDAEAGIALGHRRLSIIDLSPAGHQPMLSPAGRYVLILNGEIYNFADLRSELESAGHHVNWRGHSNTEVLLASFDFWGIKATLRRASGMFAL